MRGGILIALVSAVFGMGCSADVVLLTTEDAHEAGRLCDHLRRARVSVRCLEDEERDLFRLLVSNGSVAAAARALQNDPQHDASTLAPEAHGPMLRPAVHERARTREARRELQTLLEALPGVVEATVSLHLPRRRLLYPSEQGTGSANVIVHVESSSSLSAPEIAAFVATAHRELEIEHVHATIHIAENEPTPCPFAVQVGPFVVASESASALRSTLTLGLWSIIGTTALLMLTLIRHRKARHS